MGFEPSDNFRPRLARRECDQMITTTVTAQKIGKISAQNVYIAISGCRSLLQSLGDALVDLAIVDSPEFAVGISMVSHSLSISGLGSHFWFSAILESPSSPWSQTQVCRSNFDDVCHIFGDISTSGLNCRVAISGCPSMSHLFVDTFLSLPWSKLCFCSWNYNNTYFGGIRLYEST